MSDFLRAWVLFPLVIAGATALLVFAVNLVWRDMERRRRPVWLRWVVLVTNCVGMLGMLIYTVDLRRHPHEPGLSWWDKMSQGYRRLPPTSET